MVAKTQLRKRVQISFKNEPKLTLQSAKDECDINIIIKRLAAGNQLPPKLTPDQYVDFTQLPSDYHQSMEIIVKADEQFQQLPATLRERFRNNPENFLNFVSNEKNQEELVSLGLATKTPSSANSTPIKADIPPAKPEPEASKS